MSNRFAGDGNGPMYAFTKEAGRGQVSQDEEGVHGSFLFPNVIDETDAPPEELRQSLRWKIPVVFIIETEGLEDAFLRLGEALDEVGIRYQME